MDAVKTVAVTPEVHHRIKVLAAAKGLKVKELASELLLAAVRRAEQAEARKRGV